MTLHGAILRFMLGGAAVCAAFYAGKKLGGRVGGIFAAFPAVFVSAILSCAIDGGTAADISSRAFTIARGALIGMTVNIFCAALAGVLITKYGWRRGIALALGGWLAAAALIFGGAAALGWIAS